MKQHVKNLENVIYSSVIGICETLEAEKSYRGNGHHLAQKISRQLVIDLLPAQERKAYDQLSSTEWKKTYEIAEALDWFTTHTSAILFNIHRKTALISLKKEGHFCYWKKT